MNVNFFLFLFYPVSLFFPPFFVFLNINQHLLHRVSAKTFCKCRFSRQITLFCEFFSLAFAGDIPELVRIRGHDGTVSRV